MQRPHCAQRHFPTESGHAPRCAAYCRQISICHRRWPATRTHVGIALADSRDDRTRRDRPVKRKPPNSIRRGGEAARNRNWQVADADGEIELFGDEVDMLIGQDKLDVDLRIPRQKLAQCRSRHIRGRTGSMCRCGWYRRGAGLWQANLRAPYGRECPAVRSAKSSPAVVGCRRRVVRDTSSTPRSCSSLASDRLTA